MKKPRRILKDFTIHEISAVDVPAQEHALAVLIKRGAEVAKAEPLIAAMIKRYVDPADGATPFSSVLYETMECDRYHAVVNAVQPALNALDTSLRSIVADRQLTTEAKSALMAGACNEFLDLVESRWPEVKQALAKGLTEEGADDMRKTANGDLLATFEDAVEHLRATNKGMSRTQAMSTARQRYPDLYAKHQTGGPVAKSEPSTPGPAVARFLEKVDHLAEVRKCSRTEAMRQARRRHPDLFEQYQAAR